MSLAFLTLGQAGAAAASPLADFRQALSRAKVGEVITLADGVYRDPGSLRLTESGTAARPTVVRAETPGGVTFQGRAQLRVEANHVIVEGFRFAGGRPASDHGALVVEGNDVRLTECTIYGFNLGDDPAKSTHWVNLDGERLRVDHCWFEGKVGAGVLLVLQRRTARADHALIEHNVFRRFAYGGGANGYETIRLGTSHQSRSDSCSMVAGNYFEACDGEIEIISVKSGANTIRDNTFIDCRGAVTLRHGRGTAATGNVFFATQPDCGGFRISDGGHRIEGNYIQGVRTSNPHLGGIVLMSSESADPAPPLYAHWPVGAVTIARNTLVDCVPAFVYGGGNYGHGPVSAAFTGNFVSSTPAGAALRVLLPIAAPNYERELYAGVVWDGPAPAGVATPPAVPVEGVSQNGYRLLRPAAAAVGADLATLRPLRSADAGPTRYRP